VRRPDAALVGIIGHLRFGRLLTPTLLSAHVADYGLCSLIHMHMLYPDVLVTTVA